jgi:ATP-dependent DNA helicase DinG
MSEILGTDGPFAELLDGFAPRRQQQELAEAIQRVFVGGGPLVGEAGTGVGKTFAYLVPALLAGRKVVISTGTRHLQDQLFYKDIPLVRRALRADVKTALLKGRANYLCRHRLDAARGHPSLRDPQLTDQLETIREWAASTSTGEISEVSELPEDAPIWRHVTSDADVCGQHEGRELDDCFVYQARRTAQQADVVVVNHHLFFADLALKEGGFGDLLPEVSFIVLDEAHQIPEIAAQFFGKRLTSRQLRDLARDCAAEQQAEARDMGDLMTASNVLELESNKFRLAFGRSPRRDAWREVASQPTVREALDRLRTAYQRLHEQLDIAATRSKGLSACLRRCETQVAVLESFADASARGEWIHWFETFRNGFQLSRTPLDIAVPFQRMAASLNAHWVYTSATLSVGGNFKHFRRQLGLDEAEECRQDSPFDFQRNALLYLPENMPEPREQHFTNTVLNRALPVIQASQGRAFLLFTSYNALNEAAEWLAGRIEFPILVQGQKPKLDLLDQFQALGNAVLLGTSSFWEGVDVRGQALSCVIIDKLPFGSPGDPVMQARINALRESGANPFFDYQVPQAAITLKQGAGRLIRDVSDRGVLMLCDPRLLTKGYGRTFLQSLPAMPRTRNPADVVDFFRT